MELQGVVTTPADTAVVVGRVDIRIQLAGPRIARTWCERHVVVTTDIEAATAGTDVIEADRCGVIQLLSRLKFHCIE